MIVGSKADHKALKSKSSYVPGALTAHHPELHVIEGVQPPALTVIPYSIRLAFYDTPQLLLDTISSGTVVEITKKLKELFIQPSIDTGLYGQFFQTLLW